MPTKFATVGDGPTPSLRRAAQGGCSPPASMLADLGVSAVACLGRGSAESARAFAARGVAPLDLRFLAPAHGAGRASAAVALLPALDRLLSLVRDAQGAVVVHVGSGGDWPASSLGMLTAAFLISWVHIMMVAPTMLPS
jgi:hypothetical protein